MQRVGARKNWSIVVGLSLIPLLANTPPVNANAQLDSLPDNTWVELTPTPSPHRHADNTSTWVNCSVSSSLSNPIGRGFTGPALGGGKIFYFGGAHNSHPGNDVDLYDIEQNIWQQTYQPECLPACSDINPSCSGCTDPRDSDVCDIREGGASIQVLTPSGRPYVEQSYQQHVWDPIRGQFMNGLRSGLWGYDPVTHTWEWHYGCGDGIGDDGICGPPSPDDCRLQNPYNETCANPTLPNQPPAALGAKFMAYDPDLQTIVWNAGGVTSKFNFGNKTWTTIGPQMSLGGGERFSSYNPDGRYHLVHLYNDSQNPHMYKFDAVNGVWRGLNPPAALGTGGCWPSGSSYDPIHRVFLVLQNTACGGNGPVTLWEYAPGAFTDEGQWRQITLNGPVPSGRGRWQPLWYDSTNNVFFYINMLSGGPKGGFGQGDVETWAFRYNPGPATPQPGSLQWSASTASVTEGATNVTLSVTRTGGSSGAVGISYATANGSALAGSDYTTSASTVSFADGDVAAKTITVPILNDTTTESNETFTVTLSNPTGGATAGSPSVLTVTITDDDGVTAPVITADPVNVTVTEGQTALFDVVASGSAPLSYQWQYSTDAGATWANVTSGTGGTTSIYTTAATTTADTSTRFRCRVTNAAGTATSNSATLTVNAGSGGGTFTCTKILGFSQTREWFEANNPNAFEVAVGNDAGWEMQWRGLAGIEVWADPSSDIWNSTDPWQEPLSSPCAANATNPDRVLVTITSNPNYTWDRTIASNWAPYIEGVITQIRARYSNTRSIMLQPVVGGPNHQVCFISGTPVRASETHPIIDQAIALVVAAHAGDPAGPVAAGMSPEVSSCADYQDTLGHLLGAAEGATGTLIGQYYAAAPTPQPGSLQWSASTASVTEGTANLTLSVTRTGGSSGPVGISYATANGSALAGSDYTTSASTVSFADGDAAAKTITVPILNDTTTESNETFTVTLSNPTGGATLGTPATHTVTITDDDVPASAGALQWELASSSVGESAGTATLRVTRTGGSSGAVGISYDTANGTATAGSDYTAVPSGTVSFAAGDAATKSVNLSIANDTAVESDETFTITLSNPTGGATLGTPLTHTVTITDDDTGGGGGPLSIPLTITELLPADDAGGIIPNNVVGRARTQEPVTSGIPLKDSDAVSNVSQLAIEDTVSGQLIPAQFRVLRRYPSGNIQWILVDVQADVSANGTNSQLRLMKGTNPGGANLAQDMGSTIIVSAWPSQFTIRKANQNVIDAVDVNGSTLLAAGHTGAIRYLNSTGTEFTSRNDSASTAVIEENGPLKAVIKEQGRLRSVAGVNAMGYTARLIFYKGKSYARMELSIENGFRDDPTRKALGSLEVRLPLTLDTGRAFNLATQTSLTGGTLSASDTVYLYQGRTDHKNDSEAVGTSGRPNFFQEENDWGATYAGTGQDGFTIVQNSTVLKPFQGLLEYSRGMGDLQDSIGQGLSVAMRDFDSYFPSAIEFTGSGEVAVELWSKRNTRTPLTFDWGSHDTRDILLDFHDVGQTTSGLELTHYRIQYPLFARAPYEQYRDAAALLGRTDLVTLNELVNYHQQNDAGLGVNQFLQANVNFDITQYTMPNQQIVRTRSYNWSDGGRQTNNDYSAAKVLSFLQTGHGGQFQSAYNFVRFIADIAVHHSDREDRTAWPSVPNATGPGSPYAVGGLAASTFEDDMEHENVLGVPMLYYITGNESLRESLIDHGEWLVRDHAFTVTCQPGNRSTGQRMKWHAILWELTGNPQHKTELDKLVDNALCATIANTTDFNDVGQDLDRGYIFDPSAGQTTRSVSVGAGLWVRGESFAEAVRVLPDTDPRKEELLDRLMGLAYWTAREGYFDRNGDPCPAFGAPSQTPSFSEYDPDVAPASESTRIQASLFDHSAVIGHGYRMTKDPLFLYAGQRIVGAFGTYGSSGGCSGGVTAVRQIYAPYSGFFAQRFIYTELHKDEFGVTFLNDDPASAGGLQVTDNGGGSYTLRWTVPANAVKYQIKYGPQPMVLNLNFDKYARTYQYNPATYDNFWAGNGDQIANQPRNITTEPAPAAAGTQQTVTLTGLPANSRFAMKMFTSTAATPGIPGDLNANGTVDAVDLQLMVSVLLGIEQDPLIVARAELDGQNGVTAGDLQQLVNQLLGL